MSEFLIQVVHKEDGKVVAWQPGREIELSLIEELRERVRLKGVGLGRTSTHVLNDVVEALQELLHDLKAKV